MKVDELKVRSWRRGTSSSLKTGNKVWLQRRLHAAIVRKYLESEMDYGA